MTFQAPWFLLTGIAAALPIIIHLWFKKRLRKIQFSSLTFLQTTEAKRFGWLRLREILVLASRCCFIVCLALSLARPRVQGSIFGAARTASVVLVIDNSYSMHYAKNFERAKEETRMIIERFSPQTQYLVVPVCPVAGATTDVSFWTNKRSALTILDTIDLTYKQGVVFDALTHLPLQDARYPVERIYIGDGQAVAFAGYPDTMPVLHWAHVPAGTNAGITHVGPWDPIALPKETYDMAITARNYSPTRFEGTISLNAPSFTQELPCTIPARDEHTYRITLPSTVHQGATLLHEDSLDPDNARYFSHHIRRIIRVLIVGNNHFIENALQPTTASRSPFNVHTIDRLGNTDIRLYDVIIMCGGVHVSTAERAVLEYCAEQNDVSIICLLGHALDQQMIEFLSLYCSVDKRIDPPGYVTIDWIDYDHPVFSIFQNDPSLKNVRIFNYWSVTSTTKVHARITDENPLIISRNKVTIITTDLTPSATDLMYTTAFVPLLFRLIMVGIQPGVSLEYTVGDINKATASLQAPTGELIFPDDEFVRPGLYFNGDTAVAVNVLPNEGNTALLGTDAARLLHISLIDPHDLSATDLSPLFLICALAFLLFEVLMLLFR